MHRAPGRAVRLLVQRVREASVEADGNTVARIGAGLLVLAGIAGDDTADDREWLARTQRPRLPWQTRCGARRNFARRCRETH